jgi:signal transduction histidine kinase
VQGGRIDVHARIEGGHVVLEVRDTGVGPSGQGPLSGKGFGTVQIRERLDALYGNSATIEFAAAPEGGARAVIRYPREGTS